MPPDCHLSLSGRLASPAECEEEAGSPGWSSQRDQAVVDSGGTQADDQHWEGFAPQPAGSSGHMDSKTQGYGHSPFPLTTEHLFLALWQRCP